MRVHVTGAGGFVGRHLVQALETNGHEVVSLRNPDLLIHAGAVVGRERCERDKNHALSSNVASTLEYAEACAENGTSMVYVSSVEATRGGNLYALTKRWAEDACRLALPSEHLSIARLGVQYGPGARLGADTVLNFLQAAMRGEELRVYRDTYRTWTYVEDSARALVLIAEAALRWREHGKHIPDPAIFDVDSGERHALVEVAEMVVGAVGSGRTVEVAAPPGYSTPSPVDTKRLRALGWKPQITFDVGLARTYSWLREPIRVAA